MKYFLIILLLCLNSWAGEVLIQDSQGCVKQPKNTPTPDPAVCVKEFYCCRKDKKLYPRVDDRQMSCTGDFGSEQLLSSQFAVPCAKYPATYDPHDDCPESVLTVSVEGPGKVTSNVSGINCGDDCTEEYPSGVDVELTASPEAGAEFVSWSGACSGTSEVCRLKTDENRDVHAVFKTNVLTVALAGDGQGSVSGTGISCGADCEEKFKSGTSVTLSATAISTEDFESVFINWSGACSGTGPCSVTMNGDKAVTANFKRTYIYKLNVVKSGVGTGTVTGIDINCGGTCEKIYDAGTKVSLTAKADTGSTFKGWSGACTGTSTCSVTMDKAKTVVADFEKPGSKSLTVTVAGEGVGSVTGPKIDCSPDCRETYLPTPVEKVVLTAVYDPAVSTFRGWSSACSGTSPTCSVTMDASRTVTATFDSTQLTVNKAGTGSGVVTSAPTGINCGSDCVKKYPPKSSVTLTQKADSGSVFKSWSGACTGSGSCGVTLAASGKQSVTATFDKASALVVTKSGAGTGTVTSPSDIDCGSKCKKEIVAGTKVSLTATPDANSFFKEWQGRCTGANTTCSNLEIRGVTSVTAVFDANILTVKKAGNGTVTSADSTINCGGTCFGKYGRNAKVNLSATPASGSAFIGWSGACTGLGVCTVTMSSSKEVKATFSESGLTVEKTGTGGGDVRSTPSAIVCGAKCGAEFPKNSVVELNATPDAISRFDGWGLDCAGAGKGKCSVTMNGHRKASALFNEICNHNGICERGSREENCRNCDDCQIGSCSGANGENCGTCPEKPSCACPTNKNCESSGSSFRCVSSCGDGFCNSDQGETCNTCAADCGECADFEPVVDGCNTAGQACGHKGRKCCAGNACCGGVCKAQGESCASACVGSGGNTTGDCCPGLTRCNGVCQSSCSSSCVGSGGSASGTCCSGLTRCNGVCQSSCGSSCIGSGGSAAGTCCSGLSRCNGVCQSNCGPACVGEGGNLTGTCCSGLTRCNGVCRSSCGPTCVGEGGSGSGNCCSGLSRCNGVCRSSCSNPGGGGGGSNCNTNGCPGSHPTCNSSTGRCCFMDGINPPRCL